jgi:hypothetical protein
LRDASNPATPLTSPRSFADRPSGPAARL